MGRKKTKFTLREIMELQCKKCNNPFCLCRECKGEFNMCFYDEAEEPCDWISPDDPICDGFR